jgi:antitoxin component of MazEF toxin-antitoxin module
MLTATLCNVGDSVMMVIPQIIARRLGLRANTTVEGQRMG